MSMNALGIRSHRAASSKRVAAAIAVALLALLASATSQSNANTRNYLPSIWLTGDLAGNNCAADPSGVPGQACKHHFISLVAPSKASADPYYENATNSGTSTTVINPNAAGYPPFTEIVVQKQLTDAGWWFDDFSLPGAKTPPKPIGQIFTASSVGYSDVNHPHDEWHYGSPSTTEIQILRGDEPDFLGGWIPATPQATQRCKAFSGKLPARYIWNRNAPILYAAGFGSTTATTLYGGTLRAVAVGNLQTDHFRFYDKQMNPTGQTFPAKHGVGIVELELPPGLPEGIYPLGIAAENKASTQSTVPFPCWQMYKPLTPEISISSMRSEQSAAVAIDRAKRLIIGKRLDAKAVSQAGSGLTELLARTRPVKRR